VLTVFLTLSTVFVLIRLAPGDPAYSMAVHWPQRRTLQVRTRWASIIDLRPVPAVLKGLLQLDLGTSYSFQAPALDVVLGRLPIHDHLAIGDPATTVIAIPLALGWRATQTAAVNSRPTCHHRRTVHARLLDGLMLLTSSPCSSRSYRPLASPNGRHSSFRVTVAVLQIALISRWSDARWSVRSVAVHDGGSLPWGQ